MSWLSEIPAHIWAVVSAIGVSVVGAFATLGVSKAGSRQSRSEQNDDRLIALVDQLQEEVVRLGARVGVLEARSDAYRSWAHVLWAHIHDTSRPRLPAPDWSSDLPR